MRIRHIRRLFRAMRESSEPRSPAAARIGCLTIRGIMGRRRSHKVTKILMTALVLSAAFAAQGQDIDGTWQGTLDTGAGTLRVVVHLSSTKDGFTATMDSPDQGASGLPVSLVKRDGDAFTLALQALGAKFDGVISKDLSTIEGTFIQGGASLPLVLKRGTAAAAADRKSVV